MQTPVELSSADDRHVDTAVEVFSLLADPTRVRIILELQHGELPVCELAHRIGKSPTSVSRHLARLRWGRIVTNRQQGTWMYYRLTDEHARTLVTEAIFQAEHIEDPAPAHHAADRATAVEQDGHAG